MLIRIIVGIWIIILAVSPINPKFGELRRTLSILYLENFVTGLNIVLNFPRIYPGLLDS